MKRNFFGFFLFLLISGSVFAQSETASDSLKYTPLRKSNFLVGLGGSISSNNIAQTTFATNAAQFGNTYQFDLLLGKFIADKNLLGLQFNTKKVSLLGDIESTADLTNIGPIYRLYLGKEPNITLFLQTSFKWSSYYGLTRGSISGYNVDQEIRAQGVYGSLGLGVSYIVARRVAFDVSCKYFSSRYWGTISDYEIDEKNDLTLDFRGLNFSFGFNVLFGKIKQDD